MEFDMLQWMSRCSLECIGRAGVGVSFDDLHDESRPTKYMVAAKQLLSVIRLQLQLLALLTSEKTTIFLATSIHAHDTLYRQTWLAETLGSPGGMCTTS